MLDIIVIGGGPAGVTAALRARELGATVGIIERDRFGGTCTNDGCVPTRVLARAARLAREARQFHEYGLNISDPELDFNKLIQRAQQVVYSIHEKKQLIKTLTAAGVETYVGVGNAEFLDPHTISLTDGRELKANKFIICVGGQARRLSFPGSEFAITHSDVWTLTHAPKRLAIVGASATGCQLASIFNALGTDVIMLEVNDRILKLEDPTISSVIHDAFSKRGVDFILNIEGIERIIQKENTLVLVYQQDGVTCELESDAVVFAVGWPGNVQGLNLTSAGVNVDRGYIPVDDYMRTSVEHIFAAGDITGRMGLVQRAGYDARVAAENAVLGAGQHYRHQIVPHGGFTDPEYGSVGMTEEEARKVDDPVVAEVPFANLDRAVIDGRIDGCCKLIASRESHRILGAQVVGEQALEIIHLVAAGMTSGMWIEQLAELEIAYPTYTAVVGLAARQIIRELGVVPIAPQWRAIGKDLAVDWERRDSIESS